MDNGSVQRENFTYSESHKEKIIKTNLLASSRIRNHDSESVRATYASTATFLKNILK